MRVVPTIKSLATLAEERDIQATVFTELGAKQASLLLRQGARDNRTDLEAAIAELLADRHAVSVDVQLAPWTLSASELEAKVGAALVGGLMCEAPVFPPALGYVWAEEFCLALLNEEVFRAHVASVHPSRIFATDELWIAFGTPRHFGVLAVFGED